MDKVGFLGTGKMGSALIKGILNKGIISSEDVIVYDPDESKTKLLAQSYGVKSSASAKEVAAVSDFLFLCIKPQVIDGVLDDIADSLKNNVVLVSIAAGVSTKQINARLKEDKAVIRCMPNTPVLVNEGMTIICTDASPDKNKTRYVIKLFESVGKTKLLEERLMNEVIALSGSSPAYVYMFIDAIAKGAIKQGIPGDIVYEIAAQTVLGSAKMVLETKESPEKLKNDVCAPGGTTIEAVSKLKEAGFEEAIIAAMEACTDKAYILGSKVRKKA